jgi:hypothetical protein
MFPEIEHFNKWLRCRSPHAATHVHYTNDVKIFFAWATKPPDTITRHDVDVYVAHCRGLGHAAATVNRRLAAVGCRDSRTRLLPLPRRRVRRCTTQPRYAQASRHPPGPTPTPRRAGQRRPEAVCRHHIAPRQGDLFDHGQVRPQGLRSASTLAGRFIR